MPNILNMRKKKITRAEKETKPLSDDLKLRVLKAKKNLPRSGIIPLFFHYYSEEYKETVKTKSRVNNVLQTRITDEDITIKLEELVTLLKKQ